MTNALVVRSTKLPQSQTGVRAAQYVRMSTEHQRYSIQNQAAVIAAYAQAHGLTIVRTYADRGESGLLIKNRAALIRLIQDVRQGRADFGHILVFDVSRWGRFQDIDESAHYEFLCKQAGIKISYCAEEFDNDGSLISNIVKNLKRVMAAEFSRELSAKVHAGACRLASLGFRQGGEVSFALRRILVDEKNETKQILQMGERKYLHTDHVRLGLGNADEVATIRWIFDRFVINRSEAKIARQLNQRGILNKYGQPWNRRLIHLILTNENYIGNLLYNRTSRRLKQKVVNNPEAKWIRSVGALEAVIEPSQLSCVKGIMEERRVSLPKDQMLARLRATLQTRGQLTAKIINETVGLPSSHTYMDHFGTLRNAYWLISWVPKRDCDWIESRQRWSAFIATLSSRVAAAIEKAGGRTDLNSGADCLLVNRAIGLSFRIARLWSGKKESHAPRWAFYRPSNVPPGWIIVIRLTRGHEAVHDYLLLHTSEVGFQMTKFSEKARSQYSWPRFETPEALVRAIVRRVIRPSGAPPPKPRQRKRLRMRRSSRRPRRSNLAPKSKYQYSAEEPIAGIASFPAGQS